MRCPSCPRRGRAADEVEANSVVNQIERFVSERNSGFALPNDLTPTEKELMILWDQNVAAFERVHQARVAQIVEAMISRAR